MIEQKEEQNRIPGITRIYTHTQILTHSQDLLTQGATRRVATYDEGLRVADRLREDLHCIEFYIL